MYVMYNPHCKNVYMLIKRLKARAGVFMQLWYKLPCKRFSWLYGAIMGLKMVIDSLQTLGNGYTLAV